MPRTMGADLEATFALALLVGAYAYAIACVRQREHLAETDRAADDEDFPVALRRALDSARVRGHIPEPSRRLACTRLSV
ncbi:MAG: hypothetical protein OEV29_11695 [Thermoleophilia bacterium]|nr:hypothetical protein [Thermoleophilia bacterium]